jgi:hypothetical protein
MLRSILGSSSGIRVKVRIAQTELTIYVHVKECVKDYQLTVGYFVLDPQRSNKSIMMLFSLLTSILSYITVLGKHCSATQ